MSFDDDCRAKSFRADPDYQRLAERLDGEHRDMKSEIEAGASQGPTGRTLFPINHDPPRATWVKEEHNAG